MYLCCFAIDAPFTWVPLFPWEKFWHNTSYQHNSKMTYFEVLYGRPPLIVFRFSLDSTSNAISSASLHQRDKTLAVFKSNLSQDQENMKI